ncbi:MAG: protein kinase domain-containing protein [Planctomycetia bacterium]
MKSAFPSEAELPVGCVLGPGFRVVAKIASTNTSTVYRAWDHTDDKYVVVKTPSDETLAVADAAERFDQEVASRQAVFHPHSLPTLDHGRHEGIPYVILPYLAGGSLRQRRPAENGVPVAAHPALLHRWLRPLADALDHMHANQVVHQNVSPDNILCDGSGSPFLNECGVAAVGRWTASRKATAQNATHPLPTGAPDYIAPELVTGSPPSAQSDQYSLAAVVYEFLTTRPPFHGLSPGATLAAHIHEPAPPIGNLSPHLPASLCEAVHRGLAKTPGHRFPSCRAFAEHTLKHVPTLDTPRKLLLLCPSCHSLVLVDAGSAGKPGKCQACSAPVFVASDLQSLIHPADRATRADLTSSSRRPPRQVLAGTAVAAAVLLLTCTIACTGAFLLFFRPSERPAPAAQPGNAPPPPGPPRPQPIDAMAIAPATIDTPPGQADETTAEAPAGHAPAPGDADAPTPAAIPDPTAIAAAVKARSEEQPRPEPHKPDPAAAPQAPPPRPRFEDVAATRLKNDLATLHQTRTQLVSQKRSSQQSINALERQAHQLKTDLNETPLLLAQQQALLDIAITKQFAQQSLPPTRPNVEVLNALNAQVKDIQDEITRLKTKRLQIPGELEIISSRIGAERAALQEVIESGENLRRQWITRVNPMLRDNLLQEKLDALTGEILRSPDFHECLLYRAMLFILAGKSQEAIADLEHAEDLLVDDNEITTPPIAIDFVYASLMAGQGSRARRYLRAAENRWPNDPVIQHIQALCEMNENSFSTAAELFRKALKKSRTSNRAQLCGDAAWLFAAAPAEGSRKEKMARETADEALRASEEHSWTAWRALSVLHADAGQWKAAEDCLRRAAEKSPLLLAADLEEQLATYRAGKSYRIKRTTSR